MATQYQFGAADTLYGEAVAMYEAARADFEALEKLIARAVEKGQPPSADELREEERLRSDLFDARIRLSQRLRSMVPS
jgi:hypothetical protein